MTYFSDREHPTPPPTRTEISPNAWRGIAAAIRTRIRNGSFGAHFPETCPDGTVPCGTDEQSFRDAMAGKIPSLDQCATIVSQPDPPPLTDAMDVIEFCWSAVGKPIRTEYHFFCNHHHLQFDNRTGKSEFCEEINLIFRRNQLAYKLNEEGKIERLLPPEVSPSVHGRYRSSDDELNGMLESACRKFVDPDERIRREALKDLWDAWERIKTIDGIDKKSGISNLLDQVAGSSDSQFRSFVETDAKELTKIGNRCQIRHSETDQERVDLPMRVDYLWYRMFALITLILGEIEAVDKNERVRPTRPEDEDIPF